MADDQRSPTKSGLRRHLLQFIAVMFTAIAAAGSWTVDAGAGIPLALNGQNGDLPSLAPIVKKVTPGVVNIAIKGRVAQEQNPLLRDPVLRRFFNLPDKPAEREIQAVGSGVIIDAGAGLIITNNHVVERADAIAVTLFDGRQLEGTRIGSDSETDIALVKVQPQNLTAIPFGDSDKLEVGDFVVAIGNPFRLGQTVTSGIVSGLRRSGLGIEQYEDFIQTDASINPGNSGGALVNLRGELVGINTAIVGPSGGNVGIGFAIPVNMARTVVDQIVKFGEVRRGRLGIAIQDLTPELARQKGVAASQSGALVATVEAGSAAERAGLKVGDVVVAVGGAPVRNSSDLRNKIGLLRIGDQVELSVLRDGRSISIRATVAERERRVRQ